jgi:HD-like signal output (HDOD) protein
MERKRILFVDDEPHVLGGLQDLLRRHRREWDMVFVASGQMALDELEKAPFDVVVSDMRMPGMDGSELLRCVQHEYPSIARIILSGYAEREAMIRALPVAHQFLSKPCGRDELHAAIERACSLQVLLNDDVARKLVGGLDKLPSVPRCYLDLTSAVASEAGLETVGNIVERDPAMSAKVLQLVNSGYFGVGQRVTSVQRAVVYLGIDMLRGLALTAEVFSTLNVPVIEHFSLDALQEHSFLTARVAKRLVTDQKRGEEAFAAGIVHDIGKLILALVLPDGFAEAHRVSRERGQPGFQVEKELLGVTHAEVGGYLLGTWGLPMSIVEAVAYHHAPHLAPPGSTDVLAAVHVADALVTSSLEPEASLSDAQLLDVKFLESTQLIAKMPQWRELVEAELLGVTRAG